MFKITMPSGESKDIQISLFAAMDGWDMQARFIDFASSTDSDFRRAYTLAVLSYAKVIQDGREIPLSTDALIDNHLQTWPNVKAVFEEVLSRNGIDPSTHADRPHYWSEAGAEMAASFIAEAAKLMGPAMHAIDAASKAE